MAQYTVEAPNGKTYTLEAAEGIDINVLSAALYQQVPEAATPLKPQTLGGNVKEAFKGVQMPKFILSFAGAVFLEYLL